MCLVWIMKFRGFGYHEAADNLAKTTAAQPQMNPSQGCWETSIYHGDTRACLLNHSVVFASDVGSFSTPFGGCIVSVTHCARFHQKQVPKCTTYTSSTSISTTNIVFNVFGVKNKRLAPFRLALVCTGWSGQLIASMHFHGTSTGRYKHQNISRKLLTR